MKDRLKHKLVPDSNSCDMVGTICLKGIFDGIALPRIWCDIVGNNIIAKIDFQVNFSLSDSFELGKSK